MNYKELADKEKRAKLLGILASKTDGRLSKEQLEIIANKINIDLKFTIIVIKDAKEMAEISKLKHEGENYKEIDISNGYKETCMQQLLGDIKFGVKDNYIMGIEEIIREEESDFNVNDDIVFTKKKTSWDDENKYIRDTNELIIYLPNNEPYRMDKNIRYIIDNFNVK